MSDLDTIKFHNQIFTGYIYDHSYEHVIDEPLNLTVKMQVIDVIPEKAVKKDTSIPLNFHQLAEMLNEPVYVKDPGCKGEWEILKGVRKTTNGEEVCFKGYDRWHILRKNIYYAKNELE